MAQSSSTSMAELEPASFPQDRVGLRHPGLNGLHIQWIPDSLGMGVGQLGFGSFKLEGSQW